MGLSEVPCHGRVTLAKNSYYPGEEVHAIVDLDNSGINDPCRLEITYVCTGTFRQKNYSKTEEIVKEKILCPLLVAPRQVVSNF